MTAPTPAPYTFRLYVAGHSEPSQTAESRLRSLCEALLPGRYELEVIDVTERPDIAAEERIVVIPTAVRLTPWPQRWVIGDLSDDTRTAAALGFPDPDQLASERWRP